jgi:hypothetical protein
MIISGGGIHIPGPPMGGGSAAPPPVTPLTIFGAASVLQWCRADLGVTVATGVSVWADQSGNGKDYLQATAANQPTLTAADATLNNLPTIGFDGVNDTMLAATLNFGLVAAAPICCLMIMKTTADLGHNMVIVGSSVDGGSHCVVYAATAISLNRYNGAVVLSASMALNAWGRGRFDFSNQATDIGRFAASQNSNNAGNSAQGAGRAISAWNGGGSTWKGQFFEIAYLNRIPTPAEMTAYDAYVTAITAGQAGV